MLVFMNKLLALLAFSLPLLAQTQPPDCPLQQKSLSAAGDVQFDNRNSGCNSWTVYYVADAGLSFTAEFQSTNGQNAPGSLGYLRRQHVQLEHVVWNGPIWDCNLLRFGDLRSFNGGDSRNKLGPCRRLGVTGTGTIRVFFYGYRTGYAAGLAGGGGGGGGSGCTNPCVVIGPDAPGAASTQDPVQIAGNDGTDVRAVSTDTSGVVNVNVKSSVPPTGATAFTSKQQAVTGSAANLGTNTAKSVCVKALIGNTINVYVGAVGVTTATGFELPPGLGTCLGVGNTNLLYVIASTTGASVSVEWTN